MRLVAVGRASAAVADPAGLSIALDARGETIFKGSSLAMTVGAMEVAYVTQQIGAETFRWVEANVFGTSVYLACAWLIAGIMTLVERWTRVAGLMAKGQ
jgi:ABC-type arginine/histidine transport system permease subunit